MLTLTLQASDKRLTLASGKMNRHLPRTVQYGDRWTNMTVKVTKPDGTTETLGPFTSDDTGGTHTDFTPTDSRQLHFPDVLSGQILPGNNLPPPGYYTNVTQTEAYIGDYFEPSLVP